MSAYVCVCTWVNGVRRGLSRERRMVPPRNKIWCTGRRRGVYAQVMGDGWSVWWRAIANSSTHTHEADEATPVKSPVGNDTISIHLRSKLTLVYPSSSPSAIGSSILPLPILQESPFLLPSLPRSLPNSCKDPSPLARSNQSQRNTPWQQDSSPLDPPRWDDGGESRSKPSSTAKKPLPDHQHVLASKVNHTD